MKLLATPLTAIGRHRHCNNSEYAWLFHWVLAYSLWNRKINLLLFLNLLTQKLERERRNTDCHFFNMLRTVTQLDVSVPS